MASAYMSMSAGSPQPMTAMKVLIGSCRRESGWMDAVRVRRYSWQFCEVVPVSPALSPPGKFEVNEQPRTYTAVKVADEDDQHPARDIPTGIEALEGVRLSIAIQHRVLAYATDGFVRRQVVVAQDGALEVGWVHFVTIVDAFPGKGASCFLFCCCRHW